MKVRLTLLLAMALFLSTAFLPARSGAQPRNDYQSHGAPAHNPPRANQGHMPPGPPARRPAGSQRLAEHLPTGHVNDMPHVNHNQWFGQERPDDPRFRVARPFAHGRFAHPGPGFRYEVSRYDVRLHRFWFQGGPGFEVAAWDWPLCADWCWSCGDDFAVYDDPDHAGWYLLYNVHTGVYVHVQHLGM